MIRTVTLEDKLKWEEIVGRDCEVYDMWQYVSAFEKNNDGQPILLYKEYANGIIYNVILKRDISKISEFNSQKQVYDFISPYGYAGIKKVGEINDHDIKNFLEEYTKYCQKKQYNK